MVGNALAVFVGAGFGACLRWLAGVFLGGLHPGVHFGTLTANILGCFLAGIASGVFLRHAGIPQEMRLLLVTGFLGGLTTFSSFAMEIHSLLADARQYHALLTLAGNLVGSLAAVFIGFWLYNRLSAGA